MAKKKQNNKKKINGKTGKTRVSRVALFFCLSVVALIAATTALDTLGYFNWIRWSFVPEGTVEQGTLNSKDEIDEIPDGEIRYKLNKTVTFKRPFSKGDLCFENPTQSSLDLKFYLYAGDGKSGQLVYETPLLKPGEYIAGDKLDKMLDRGTYSLLCIAVAYNSEGRREGEVSSYISVVVQKR